MAAKTVLDAAALLSLLKDDAGAPRVRGALEKAAAKGDVVHMSEVAYADVKCDVLKKMGEEYWPAIALEMTALPIEFHQVDRATSELAGSFRAAQNIQLSDAFSAALAKLIRAELITFGRDYGAVGSQIKVTGIEQ